MTDITAVWPFKDFGFSNYSLVQYITGLLNLFFWQIKVLFDYDFLCAFYWIICCLCGFRIIHSSLADYKGVCSLFWELEILVVHLFEFPAKIVERHYSSKFIYVSCRSSVCLFEFEFPAQIIKRHYSSKFVNVSCRSSVAHPSSVAGSLPRTACYFLFSFFSSLIMSENHLDACRLVDAYFRLNLEW